MKTPIIAYIAGVSIVCPKCYKRLKQTRDQPFGASKVHTDDWADPFTRSKQWLMCAHCGVEIATLTLGNSAEWNEFADRDDEPDDCNHEDGTHEYRGRMLCDNCEEDLGEVCQHATLVEGSSWNGRRIYISCSECGDDMDERDATPDEIAVYTRDHPGR